MKRALKRVGALEHAGRLADSPFLEIKDYECTFSAEALPTNADHTRPRKRIVGSQKPQATSACSACRKLALQMDEKTGRASVSNSKHVAFAGVLLLSATVALAQGFIIQPGQWEMISTTKSVDMPSAPPQVTQAMTGRATTLRRCITAQEAANGGREMLKTNKSCTFGHYVMAGGKFDAEMTCSQGGGTMTATSTGTYTATTMSSTSRITMKVPAPMTITTSVVGKRVGAC